MRVQGEAAERRGLIARRPFASAVLAALAGLLLYLYAPLPAPDAPAPSDGDCVELHLWSNGFHSDLGAPAAIFPADHPLRRLYPDATSFLIGWGEEAFYRSGGTDLLMGLDAIIPPSPSVLHIAYNAAQSSVYLGPNDDLPIAVSREGAARFVAFVDRALALDEAGQPIFVAPGKVIGRSAFLRAHGSFHLFNVCNQWMARALRAAGVNVNARTAWLAGGLIQQVRNVGRAGCAGSPSTGSG